MKKMLSGLLLMSILFLSSCAGSTKQDPPSPSDSKNGAVYHKISAAEALQIMEDSGDYILLDVRTKEEFQEQRIDGAILIPVDQIGAEAEKQLPDKDATILIYCRSGRRSASAAKELVQMGYTGIYDFGGIIDWPYNTVSSEADTTTE